MTTNTPRFQGMAAPAGKTAKLADAVLENVSADGEIKDRTIHLEANSSSVLILLSFVP